MFPKIKELPQVRDDINRFQRLLNSVYDNQIKSLIKKLYDDYLDQINLIDNGHASNFDGRIKPFAVRENVEHLQKIRLKLDKLMKDAGLE